jgi:uncharacterized protein YraI
VRGEENEWLQVLAPANAAVWVKAEFIKDGKAAVDRVNLRSGPGTTYRSIGTLPENQRVVAVETRGDWLRIAPPEGLTVWISGKVVVPVEAVAAPPVPSVAPVAMTATGVVDRHEEPATEPAITTGRPLVRALPAGITASQLAPVLGQGAVIEREGVLERVPLAVLRGSEFRLVETRDEEKTTVCHLRGNEAQLKPLLGRRLIAKGRGFWLKGDDFPVVFPETLDAARGY